MEDDRAPHGPVAVLGEVSTGDLSSHHPETRRTRGDAVDVSELFQQPPDCAVGLNNSIGRDTRRQSTDFGTPVRLKWLDLRRGVEIELANLRRTHRPTARKLNV